MVFAACARQPRSECTVPAHHVSSRGHIDSNIGRPTASDLAFAVSSSWRRNSPRSAVRATLLGAFGGVEQEPMYKQCIAMMRPVHSQQYCGLAGDEHGMITTSTPGHTSFTNAVAIICAHRDVPPLGILARIPNAWSRSLAPITPKPPTGLRMHPFSTRNALSVAVHHHLRGRRTIRRAMTAVGPYAHTNIRFARPYNDNVLVWATPCRGSWCH